jgi:O-acetyl-ADP-ribose deacetylase (regulator of RNase III)
MVRFMAGDILRSEAEALVNTVNCVGIMGRGIALQFKNTYPANFEEYAAACGRGQVVPGKMFVHETGELSPRLIINFPTKRHWRGKSRMEDIESGLEDLIAVIKRHKIKSIAIPPLGAGLGGLDWHDVKPKIMDAVAQLEDVDVVVFEPGGAPDAAAIARNRKVPNMTPGRAALVVLLQRYLNGLMDPFVTLLEAHKLMFFLQEAGEPLRLNYQKANYGPYAENLRHVFKDIEGHLISGYADGGDTPEKRLAIIPGAFIDAERVLADNTETLARFDRVGQLVDGFETPYGLELLATVYWVTQYDGATSESEAADLVHSWNERKKRFTVDQISLAFRTLKDRGWLAGLQIADIPTVEKLAGDTVTPHFDLSRAGTQGHH